MLISLETFQANFSSHILCIAATAVELEENIEDVEKNKFYIVKYCFYSD